MPVLLSPEWRTKEGASLGEKLQVWRPRNPNHGPDKHANACQLLSTSGGQTMALNRGHTGFCTSLLYPRVRSRCAPRTSCGCWRRCWW